MEVIKKTILLKTLILLAGIQCYGQALKVDNKGTTTFNPDGTYYNLIIKGAKEGDHNEPILMPNSTNWGYIGTKTKQFYRVYAQKIYMMGLK